MNEKGIRTEILAELGNKLEGFSLNFFYKNLKSDFLKIYFKLTEVKSN